MEIQFHYVWQWCDKSHGDSVPLCMGVLDKSHGDSVPLCMGVV